MQRAALCLMALSLPCLVFANVVHRKLVPNTLRSVATEGSGRRSVPTGYEDPQSSVDVPTAMRMWLPTLIKGDKYTRLETALKALRKEEEELSEKTNDRKAFARLFEVKKEIAKKEEEKEDVKFGDIERRGIALFKDRIADAINEQLGEGTMDKKTIFLIGNQQSGGMIHGDRVVLFDKKNVFVVSTKNGSKEVKSFPKADIAYIGDAGGTLILQTNEDKLHVFPKGKNVTEIALTKQERGKLDATGIPDHYVDKSGAWHVTVDRQQSAVVLKGESIPNKTAVENVATKRDLSKLADQKPPR